LIISARAPLATQASGNTGRKSCGKRDKIELQEEAEKHIHGPFLEWYYETFPERKRKGNANDE